MVSIIITYIKNRQPAGADGAKVLPGGISDVDAKKAMLGLMALFVGWLFVRNSPTLLILNSFSITNMPRLDVFVSALTIGAGTEGANSVLKLVQYAKEAMKTKTLPSTAQNSPVVQQPDHWLEEGPQDRHARDLEVKRSALLKSIGEGEQIPLSNVDDDVHEAPDADGGEGDGAGGVAPQPADVGVAPVVRAASPAWRPAQCLLTLRREVNAKAPNRRTTEDGLIGDEAHQTRDSDHNPWVRDGQVGVVTAIDITHDPAHGCDADELAETLIRRKDRRIKYIIRDRKIASSYPKGSVPAWTWRRYTGANPHKTHVHISVSAEKELYDDPAPWRI